MCSNKNKYIFNLKQATNMSLIFLNAFISKKTDIVVLLIFVSVFSSTSESSFKDRCLNYEDRSVELLRLEYEEKVDEVNRLSELRRKMSLIEAIIYVESRGNELAYNPKEGAAGVLQIRPIMLMEINRLVGYKKYKLEDRWDRDKSIAMFIDLQSRLNKSFDFETAARIWNGGYGGMKKESTVDYWNRVKLNIKNNERYAINWPKECEN